MKTLHAFLQKIPRNYLSVALGVLLLAGGIFYLVYTYVPPNTIVLRKDGWHPRSLTVRAGTTVTFRNERGKYFWPASDFHPTHLLYPAFDPKKPIAPTDTWSFTFDEAGVYKYHDHLAAYFFGIIRVLDSKGTAVDNCGERGGPVECWQNQIFLALAEKGINAAYAELTRLYETEPAFANSCHFIVHNLGLASYQLYLSNPSTILSPSALTCAGGFYHGFMEGFLGATGDIKAASKVCDDIGKHIGVKSPDARLQCYHGIGHGAIETYVATSGAADSPEDMMRGALLRCDQIPGGVAEKYRCTSGVYNGVANFYIQKQYGFSITSSDPLVLCSQQKEENKESCYGNMETVTSWQTNRDFQKAARLVLAIPDVKYRENAIKYLVGTYVMMYLNATSSAPLLAECKALPDPYNLSCIGGVAVAFIEHGLAGSAYQRDLAACNDPSLSGPEKATCFRYFGSAIKEWYPKEQVQQMCTVFPTEFQKYCVL